MSHTIKPSELVTIHEVVLASSIRDAKQLIAIVDFISKSVRFEVRYGNQNIVIDCLNLEKARKEYNNESYTS